MDCGVEFVVLNLQASESDLIVQDSESAVLVEHLSGRNFCHSTFNGLQKGIMKKDVLVLKKTKNE